MTQIIQGLKGLCAVTGLVPCDQGVVGVDFADFQGHDNGAEIVRETTDLTPLLFGAIPVGWTLADISIVNGQGDIYGPYTPTINVDEWSALVTVPVNLGTYTIVGTPANDGSTDHPLLGTLTIVGTALGIQAGPNFGILANDDTGILATDS